MNASTIADLQPVAMANAPRYDERVTAEKIQTAVERIVALVQPLRVTAFGSRARGTHRLDSDLDLAIMLKSFDGTRERPPIFSSDLGVAMAVDLLVFDQARHEFMKDSIISVHYDIAMEGVTLYDERTGSVDSGAVARIAR